jgi:transaldolase
MTAMATSAASRLARLAALGTSVWVDGLVSSAELARLVRDDAVTGLTSNPTIFRAALRGHERERAHVGALAGLGPRALYEMIAIGDVRAAADVLAPVGGFVSLELPPELAYDTKRSVAAARELWARIGRPNAMIKIPATPAGVAAIRGAAAHGINVNATLLFSVDAYVAVADAYLSGLEDRLAAGRPIDHIGSVASFFVSRVDSAVDALLAERGRDDLAGRAAVANARVAYARFCELFSGHRFAALHSAGARPQRPLWASTATKDARYRDDKYVAELAGPDVVITMPPATLAAYRDHGRVGDALTGTGASAQASLDELAAAGIDLDAVTDRLLEEGVAAFDRSMRELLAELAPPTYQESR